MDSDFSAVSTPELVDEITTLAGHLNAAHARFLSLIAELDRRGGWAEWGVKSCAHWLNWKCGITLGAAREKVRAARALAGLPRIAGEMAAGRLSYFKVRELTRVATPANESYLLNIALCGTASHVESVVRGYRRALDAEELSREAIQQRDQGLLYYTGDDGSLVIRGQLPAEIGALFVRALEAAEDSLPNLGRGYATLTGIFSALILCPHSHGPVECTDSPRASTATVTGMSCTSNS